MIEENEYNLNIPRYVDTFEKDELIDIEQVAKDLRDLRNGEVDYKKQLLAFVMNLE